ncbi:PVC-type heme-binding CxxCH protein [Singulisphaera sp. GP187]|uniref:PVC-type heme-binding CxxCH protein n=1 Tax=Singulisphaera sp. GP187 TaxID=1882752 RepID=UPI0020B14BAD|nr:PVC-type heme-binding CxxCH protein [Singulisphaera sp. GP187]
MIAGMAVGTSRAEDAQPRPLPLAESAQKMTLPEGYKATLFAGEPDVHQPIAFTIDPKGRLWIVECYSYPIWLNGPRQKDRVIILEDTDGDGRADQRKVFYEGGTSLTGITLGFGGVWLAATPNLLFIPDADGDDTPDGPPVVKLDGWDEKAQHNMFNALNWGPDGWLWGCNGILSNSRVGKPGTPDQKRTALNCGVWRYHPTREVVEVVAHGTTNPWGLDFDERGEAFITNCVIPHLFHAVPGARFQRMFGQDFNPFSYELMPTCADHVHWDTTQKWSDIRRIGVTRTTDEAGGGHAHVGAMIYLGDNWPDAMRGSAYTCNIHGHRVNRDKLERVKSGYVARHEKDFLLANDTWFRGLELKYGPDGGVYLTDWSDIGECHENDADNAHRENGRIYKITYGDTKPTKRDLALLNDGELVDLQSHKNEWQVRTARRLLQERATSGKDVSAARSQLEALLSSDSPPARKLRALWTLNAISGLTEGSLTAVLGEAHEDVRSWAVRLLVDANTPSAGALTRLAELAKSDPSPKVRLTLASALQRLPVETRWPIAEALAAHAEDAEDTPLVLMTWYGIEPLVSADRARAASLVERAAIPKLRQFLTRRIIAADVEQGLAVLLPKTETADDTTRRDLLAGMHEALRGHKQVPIPASWAKRFDLLSRSKDASVREQAAMLGLLFGDSKAVKTLLVTLGSKTADSGERRRALDALAERRVAELVPALQRLLDDSALRSPAIRALGAYGDPAIPPSLLERYPTLSEADRDDVVATLALRPASAKVLLEAVRSKVVPRRDISATVARQILAFNDMELSKQLESAWGTLRGTSADKVALMTKYKAALTADAGRTADPSRGRLVFNKTCLQCHKLFSAGGDVGPELTGSDRANTDYILENVLDPGAAVGRDFQLTTIATTDGRLLNGIIREQNEASITLQTANERLILPREDVEEVKVSNASMMPEGLLDKLSPEEVRDLFSYLSAPAQVQPAEGQE